MKIHTLTTDSTLYKIHRDKSKMILQREKRKAFWLVCGITVAATGSPVLWLIYK